MPYNPLHTCFFFSYFQREENWCIRPRFASIVFCITSPEKNFGLFWFSLFLRCLHRDWDFDLVLTSILALKHTTETFYFFVHFFIFALYDSLARIWRSLEWFYLKHTSALNFFISIVSSSHCCVYCHFAVFSLSTIWTKCKCFCSNSSFCNNILLKLISRKLMQ